MDFKDVAQFVLDNSRAVKEMFDEYAYINLISTAHNVVNLGEDSASSEQRYFLSQCYFDLKYVPGVEGQVACEA